MCVHIEMIYYPRQNNAINLYIAFIATLRLMMHTCVSI